MIRQDLTFAHKMAYGVIQSNQNRTPFHYTVLIADKLSISKKRAFYLFEKLKSKGLI
jgi:hypothetical protein